MNLDRIEKYEDIIELDDSAGSKLVDLAEVGDSDALYVLGIAYYDGDLPPRRTDEGVKLLKKASDLGHIKARHDLACFHYYGFNLPVEFQSYEKAVELFELNINENYVPSLVFLSSMYQKGEGVEVDIKKAAKLLKLAMDNGYVPESTLQGH
ncbi:sel1 repeat family protein [Zooshikella marina]|uniref:tetratricopeptide repeat protein n=1 Tax=Zooshikella ganghwensis TaxID=202772 RepID=UPI001BB0C7A6|nr:SEL1-like repeat protein [Zooshikella ganghwensis]MBU2707197.1 sel1 repeat family protein [Zooshikella ganghwensis]